MDTRPGTDSGMNIVITGSTRGIGLGLAEEFLKRAHNVVISSRRAEDVEATVARLGQSFPDAEASGRACDVTDSDAVEQLWDHAVATFGQVDIWINNAGRNNAKQRIDMLPFDESRSTIATNLLGTIYGSVTALRGMAAQGSGWIFNMEGFGSDGLINLEQIPYGTSKYAVRYFTKGLVKTVKGSPVKVGFLSPGIVTTQMAVPPPDQRTAFHMRNKRLLNILADHVETVTPWMVERILSAHKNGTAIRWLTTPVALGRFILSPLVKRHPIDEAMARMDAAGESPRVQP